MKLIDNQCPINIQILIEFWTSISDAYPAISTKLEGELLSLALNLCTLQKQMLKPRWYAIIFHAWVGSLDENLTTVSYQINAPVTITISPLMAFSITSSVDLNQAPSLDPMMVFPKDIFENVNMWIYRISQNTIVAQEARYHEQTCRLSLGAHWDWAAIFIWNKLCDHCLHDSGLYIQKILTKREMINCQKFNFLLFLTTHSVTTAERELNGTSQISLVTHDAKGEMREI